MNLMVAQRPAPFLAALLDFDDLSRVAGRVQARSPRHNNRRTSKTQTPPATSNPRRRITTKGAKGARRPTKNAGDRSAPCPRYQLSTVHSPLPSVPPTRCPFVPACLRPYVPSSKTTLLY